MPSLNLRTKTVKPGADTQGIYVWFLCKKSEYFSNIWCFSKRKILNAIFLVHDEETIFYQIDDPQIFLGYLKIFEYSIGLDIFVFL